MNLKYTNSFRSARLLGFAMATMALPGCVNLEPTADSTNFYTLGSERSRSADEDVQRMSVRHVELSDYLQNSKVVERSGPNTIRYLPEHRWAGQLGAMVAQVVASELEASRSNLYVTVGESKLADRWISLKVLQFELVSSGGVVVTIEYYAENRKEPDSEPIEGRISQRIDTAAASMAESVGQLEEALRQAVRTISAQI